MTPGFSCFQKHNVNLWELNNMIHHGNPVDVCATLFRLFHVVLHRLNRCEVTRCNVGIAKDYTHIHLLSVLSAAVLTWGLTLAFAN